MNEIISNPFVKRIADAMTDPTKSHETVLRVGVIKTFYTDSNTADVLVNISGAEQVIYSVPVLITSNMKYFFKRGDNVIIGNMFNDPDLEVILGKIDESYVINTLSKVNSTYITLP